ncbi:MAG: Unknown protein [uncultured Thiotrichaceae bacterium]|uniref:Uncharacterized protein n=1 Tax=uncultured Thiotrichaceae bacterium TaxID=298394 RepID=A0A6S6T5D7_9GAMM|nr:MAG: Unknown protein [uncultured Thiotrichaceae bacterium]
MIKRNLTKTVRRNSSEVSLLKEQLDKVMVHHNDETEKLLKSLRKTLETIEQPKETPLPND